MSSEKYTFDNEYHSVRRGVGTDDPEYLQLQSAERQERKANEERLLSYELKSLLLVVDEYQAVAEDSKEAKQLRFKIIEQTKEIGTEMRELINSFDYRSDRYRSFINSAMFRRLVPITVREHGAEEGDLEYQERMATYLKEQFSLRAVSDTDLVEAVAMHDVEMDTAEAFLDAFATKTKEAFIESVTELVQNGELPESVLENLHRVEQIPFVLLDSYAPAQKRNASTRAAYASGKIWVTSDVLLNDVNLESVRKTVFHEFLHATSGLAINVHTFSSQTADDRKKAVEKKTGLQTLSPKTLARKNVWLNEAVTEYLALKLSGIDPDSALHSGYKGSESYQLERKELDRLLESGLDEQIIYNAYFENFDHDMAEGKGEHFATLVKAINEIEGPGGFNKIDDKFTFENITWKVLEIAGLINQSGLSAESNEMYRRAHKADMRVHSVRLSYGDHESKYYLIDPKTEEMARVLELYQENFDLAEAELNMLKKQYPKLVIEITPLYEGSEQDDV